MRLGDILKEFYRLKFGQALERSAKELDEVFLFFLFSDHFGLPNPYKVFFMEALPFFIEDFHNWHRRMGMSSSPLEWIRCC